MLDAGYSKAVRALCVWICRKGGSFAANFAMKLQMLCSRDLTLNNLPGRDSASFSAACASRSCPGCILPFKLPPPERDGTAVLASLRQLAVSIVDPFWGQLFSVHAEHCTNLMYPGQSSCIITRRIKKERTGLQYTQHESHISIDTLAGTSLRRSTQGLLWCPCTAHAEYSLPRTVGGLPHPTSVREHTKL